MIFYLYKNPENKYMFKVNTRNSRKKCEIYLKLTVKTPEGRHFYC